jgi:hypothetical protein
MQPLLKISILILVFFLPLLVLGQAPEKTNEEGLYKAKILVLDGGGECNFCSFVNDFADSGYEIFAPACNIPSGFEIKELSYSFISQFDILILRHARVGEKEWNEDVKRYVEDGGKLVVISDTENFYSSDNPTNHLASMWGVEFSGDHLGEAETIEHPITKNVKSISWCSKWSEVPGIDLCFDGIPSKHPEEVTVLARYENESALVLLRDREGEVIFGPNNGIMDNETLLFNIFEYFSGRGGKGGEGEEEKKVKKEIFVFLDKNFNGEFDEGEEGVDGMRVILKYMNEESYLIETSTQNGSASIEIKENDVPKEGEIELIIDLGENFWSTATFKTNGIESATAENIFPNFNLYRRIYYSSREDLFKTEERFLVPVQVWQKILLNYSLKKDAFSFPNWEDTSSKGYCCGITIVNDLLFEKFYNSNKEPFYLQKSDIIQTKISSSARGGKEKIELNEQLEDVIRREQLSICPFRAIEKVLPAKLAALIWGEEKIKEINRENVNNFKKEIEGGKPIAVYLVNLQPDGMNHAVLGVGYVNVEDYFIGLVYENSYPYLKPLNLEKASFVINKNGVLVSKDEDSSGYRLIVVDSLNDLKDPEMEEAIRKSLNNIDKETIKKLIEKNLTLMTISGNFSIENKKCHYVIPGSKNLVFCLLGSREKIRADIKNGLIISAVPTPDLTLNVTSKTLENGRFFLEKGGKVERREYFYFQQGILGLILVLILIFILLSLKKRKSEKTEY